jgi:hypothetical protein
MSPTHESCLLHINLSPPVARLLPNKSLAGLEYIGNVWYAICKTALSHVPATQCVCAAELISLRPEEEEVMVVVVEEEEEEEEEDDGFIKANFPWHLSHGHL